jgi:hypothetical protein
MQLSAADVSTPLLLLILAMHLVRKEVLCPIMLQVGILALFPSPDSPTFVVEKGPLTRYPYCGKFMSKLTDRHLASHQCRLQATRRQNQDLLRMHASLFDSIRIHVDDSPI